MYKANTVYTWEIFLRSEYSQSEIGVMSWGPTDKAKEAKKVLPTVVDLYRNPSKGRHLKLTETQREFDIHRPAKLVLQVLVKEDQDKEILRKIDSLVTPYKN